MTEIHYSYVTDGGVRNTRVKPSEGGTLADMRERFKKPLPLGVQSDAYHSMDKKERGRVKNGLPYFVGGTIDGTRDDKNVQARHLLTLDIEQPDPDGEQPPPPQDVLETLELLESEGWVYTSISHTRDRPRYRVVLPLREPIEGGDLTEDVLRASTQRAAERLDIGPWCRPESWALSQPMFLPAKLKGGAYWEGYTSGEAWAIERQKTRKKATPGQPADMPDERPDPVLHALKEAGMYLRANLKHKGMHFVQCPHHEAHSTESESKTVYYEAHFDGNPKAAFKCMSTSHDPINYGGLVNWLTENGHLTSDEKARTGVMDDFDAFDEEARVTHYLNTKPEEREWAWEKFAPVGKVTVLAGPGGVSKSMLMLNLLIYGALGMDWAGFTPHGPVRSLYVSYEDDKLELHKRVHALAEALSEAEDGMVRLLYDVHGSINENLRLYAADEVALSWLLMKKSDRYSSAERTERVNWLINYLSQKRIKVLVLDPAVYTHQLEEKSNEDMAAFMQTLSHIAKMAGVAVIILHHMNKQGGFQQLADVNQGSLRGASAFADNSRSVAVMVSMPAKDAANYGMDAEQAKTVAVFKHVKHNYSDSLGTMMFDRRGPLLVPRELGRASQFQVAEIKAREVADNKRREWSGEAVRVLPWLMANPGAGYNEIARKMNYDDKQRTRILNGLAELGWIRVEPGGGNSKLCTVTHDGEDWLAEQDKTRG